MIVRRPTFFGQNGGIELPEKAVPHPKSLTERSNVKGFSFIALGILDVVEYWLSVGGPMLHNLILPYRPV